MAVTVALQRRAQFCPGGWIGLEAVFHLFEIVGILPGKRLFDDCCCGRSNAGKLGQLALARELVELVSGLGADGLVSLAEGLDLVGGGKFSFEEKRNSIESRTRVGHCAGLFGAFCGHALTLPAPCGPLRFGREKVGLEEVLS